MNPNKLTIKAQEALQAAQAIAQERGHQALEPEHLLLALLNQSDGVVLPTLEKMSVPMDRLRQGLEEALSKRGQVSGGQSYMGQDLVHLLDSAEAQAKALQDDYTSTEHFLLALAKDSTSGAAELLKKSGVTSDGILKALATVRGAH